MGAAPPGAPPRFPIPPLGVALGLRCEDSSHFGRDTRGGMGLGKVPALCRISAPARGPLPEDRCKRTAARRENKNAG